MQQPPTSTPTRCHPSFLPFLPSFLVTHHIFYPSCPLSHHFLFLFQLSPSIPTALIASQHQVPPTLLSLLAFFFISLQYQLLPKHHLLLFAAAFSLLSTQSGRAKHTGHRQLAPSDKHHTLHLPAPTPLLSLFCFFSLFIFTSIPIPASFSFPLPCTFQ